MRTRGTKRYAKKRLRKREQQLNKILKSFVKGFDQTKSFDYAESESQSENFYLTLNLRHFVFDVICLRLLFHPARQNQKWFLDLPDFERVVIHQNEVELFGDIVWWTEATARIEAQADKSQSYPVQMYKGKIRGTIGDKQSRWQREPIRVRLKAAANPNSNALYEIQVSLGNTVFKLGSRK